jgi:hypothetical protein
MVSRTPVTVTVCSVVPFAEVNVDEPGETVASDGLLLDRPIVTSATGSVDSFTVNVAVPPASVVVMSAVGETTTAAADTAREAETSDV